MTVATHYEPSSGLHDGTTVSLTGDTAWLRAPHQGNLCDHAALNAAAKALYVTAYATYSSFAPIRLSGAGVVVTGVA